MENSSLDTEPPSKFEGKKEVNKKKNGTNSQLIVLLKNDKGKLKVINYAKSLEKKVISNRQKNITNMDYIKNEGYSVEENSTLTNESIEFTKISTTSLNQIVPDFHYGQKINNIEPKEKNPSTFYNITSSYSFIPQIKEENKKEELSAQQIEPENKEIQYTLYNFDEETEQKN